MGLRWGRVLLRCFSNRILISVPIQLYDLFIRHWCTSSSVFFWRLRYIYRNSGGFGSVNSTTSLYIISLDMKRRAAWLQHAPACQKSVFDTLSKFFELWKSSKNSLYWTCRGLFAPCTHPPLLNHGGLFHSFLTGWGVLHDCSTPYAEQLFDCIHLNLEVFLKGNKHRSMEG